MKPTFLYVKKHNVTGLKYFGKTVKDPAKYRGSGVRWQNHLKVHGEDVSTVWTKCFTDEEGIKSFALAFSEIFEIQSDYGWANLVPENGLMGFAQGNQLSKGIKQTPEWVEKKAQGRRGKTHTNDTINLYIAQRRGVPKRKVECPKCGQVGGISRMKQYHFDNCKKCPS